MQGRLHAGLLHAGLLHAGLLHAGLLHAHVLSSSAFWRACCSASRASFARRSSTVALSASWACA